MPKILYGVSPIGLGHATRSMVIIRELQKLGADVRVFSGGNAVEFMRARGVPAEDKVDDAVPRVVGLEMRDASLWYVRSWLAQMRNVNRVAALMRAFDPDIVVCDEEFSGMTAAGGLGKKRAFICDELELGFARGWLARKIEGRIGRWYASLQASVDLLVVPEFGEDSGNRRHVGPVVRQVTAGCGETRKAHNLPEGKFVLFSLSGSGIGLGLAKDLAAVVTEGRLRGFTLVISGNRGTRLSGPGVLDLGVVPENQDLVACAELVVSTAGKSTIDEASAAGTPIIAVPIRHHAEQERNARDLGYSADDASRLPQLIQEKIGRRGATRDFRGGAAAARLILSLA